MSKENAKKFYDEVVSQGEQNSWFAKSEAQIEEIIAKEGYDFTFADLKAVLKEHVMSQEISDEELDIAAGGRHLGGCTHDYYIQECTDTVESGSACWSGDRCHMVESTYDYVK